MDNRDFNVKGESKEQLTKTLDLLLTNQYGGSQKVKAWKYDEEIGLILYWHNPEGTNAFLSPPSIETLTNMIWDWLHSKETKNFKVSYSWDMKFQDEDVSSNLGFRVFNNTWGKVDTKGGSSITYSIASVTPAYCWYGK